MTGHDIWAFPWSSNVEKGKRGHDTRNENSETTWRFDTHRRYITVHARGGISDAENKLQAVHVSRNENTSLTRDASQIGKYYSWIRYLLHISCLLTHIRGISTSFPNTLVDSIFYTWNVSHSNITKHFLLDCISHMLLISNNTLTLFRRIYPTLEVWDTRNILSTFL